MPRLQLYQADYALIIGPHPRWVETRFRAVYGHDPVKITRIRFNRPQFLAGPKPAKPDLRWIPEEFKQSIPA